MFSRSVSGQENRRPAPSLSAAARTQGAPPGGGAHAADSPFTEIFANRFVFDVVVRMRVTHVTRCLRLRGVMSGSCVVYNQLKVLKQLNGSL